MRCARQLPLPLVIFLCTWLLLGAAGCAGSDRGRLPAEEQFRRAFRSVFDRYRNFESEKALVLARDEEGRWAYGFARGQDSEIGAVNAAKERCEQERARYGVTAACRVYAVGSEITGDPTLVAAPTPQE